MAKIRNLVQAGLLVTALGLSGTALVWASDSDHERAREAMQAEEIQPLAEILQRVSSVVPGRVLEVELERKRDRWIYEFKTIEENGMVRETKVDAKTGEVLHSEYDDH